MGRIGYFILISLVIIPLFSADMDSYDSRHISQKDSRENWETSKPF